MSHLPTVLVVVMGLALAGCGGDDDFTPGDPTPGDDDDDGADDDDATDDVFDLSKADAVLTGESAGDQAGYAVAGAGDVDGDGYADLLVGAVGESSAAADAGAVYLVLGPVEGTYGLDGAEAKITGLVDGHLAGAAVDSAGDVDGDGQHELLIGAPGDTNGGENAGAAFLLYGRSLEGEMEVDKADAKLIGEAAGDQAGYALAGVGDLDGDGYDDVMVGAPQHDAGGDEAGAAYVVYGPLDGDLDLAQADATLLGQNPGEHAGYRLAAGGDINSDGHPDLIIGGLPGDPDAAGVAYVMLGPIHGQVSLDDSDVRFVGEDGDGAGCAVAGAGDVDGDGFDDVLVGAYRASRDTVDDREGAAFLLTWPLEESADRGDALAVFWGEAPSDEAGIAVAAAGDVDGDGFDELMVSARDLAGASSGATYLFHGPVDGTKTLDRADVEFVGEEQGDDAGYYSVGCAGDVDGDLLDDVIIGAAHASGAAADAGAAYLILASSL